MSFIRGIYEFKKSFRNIERLTLKCFHLKNAVAFNYIYIYKIILMILYILFIYIIMDFSINRLTTSGLLKVVSITMDNEQN